VNLAAGSQARGLASCFPAPPLPAWEVPVYSGTARSSVQESNSPPITYPTVPAPSFAPANSVAGSQPPALSSCFPAPHRPAQEVAKSAVQEANLPPITKHLVTALSFVPDNAMTGSHPLSLASYFPAPPRQALLEIPVDSATAQSMGGQVANSLPTPIPLVRIPPPSPQAFEVPVDPPTAKSAVTEINSLPRPIPLDHARSFEPANSMAGSQPLLLSSYFPATPRQALLEVPVDSATAKSPVLEANSLPTPIPLVTAPSLEPANEGAGSQPLVLASYFSAPPRKATEAPADTAILSLQEPDDESGLIAMVVPPFGNTVEKETDNINSFLIDLIQDPAGLVAYTDKLHAAKKRPTKKKEPIKSNYCPCFILILH
jgi:hypothetical protein